MSPPLTEHTGIGCIVMRPVVVVVISTDRQTPQHKQNHLLRRSATTSLCKVRRQSSFPCRVTDIFHCAKLTETDHAPDTSLVRAGHMVGYVFNADKTRGLYKYHNKSNFSARCIFLITVSTYMLSGKCKRL